MIGDVVQDLEFLYYSMTRYNNIVSKTVKSFEMKGGVKNAEESNVDEICPGFAYRMAAADGGRQRCCCL